MRDDWEIFVKNYDFPWRFDAQWGVYNQPLSKAEILEFSEGLLDAEDMESEIQNRHT